MAEKTQTKERYGFTEIATLTEQRVFDSKENKYYTDLEVLLLILNKLDNMEKYITGK